MMLQSPDIVPQGLHAGSTIALVSPSARLNGAFAPVLARANEALKSRGFKVKTFWTTPSRQMTIAQSVRDRIDELRAAFEDRDVSAIICTIGGTTANELVPSLLHDEHLINCIRANPKVFVGYSDITVLHWAFAALAGLRTFYGPTALPELGEAPEPMRFTMDNLFRAISPNSQLTPSRSEPRGMRASTLGPVPRSDTYAPKLPDYFSGKVESTVERVAAKSPPWKWLRRGKAQGRLFGGCLPIVVRLQGIRKLAPNWKDKILFVETAFKGDDITQGTEIERIQASLGDLVAQGVFDDIEGLVFGRCFGYNDAASLQKLELMVREMLCPEQIEGEDGLAVGLKGRNKFPILMHVDFGHTSPMITLPMGALADLNSDEDAFTLLESSVIH